MEVPTLLATLIPSDQYGLAMNAFCQEHNKDRYLAPRCIEKDPSLSSREPTPTSGELIADERNGKYDHTHRLALNLDTGVKNPAKGFCFGSNPKICDIVLGTRRQGISNLHFYINFRTFNGTRQLILKDVSTSGTTVTYNGQAREEVRDHFIWILDLEKAENKWELEVYIRQLRFVIELANHETCAEEHEKEVEKFLLKESTLEALAIYTPTEPISPAGQSRRPIYIHERELGRGSFGSVDKVTNVSTGGIYARKNVFEPQSASSERRRAQQREEWLQRVHREIRIMKENRHVSIVTSWNGMALTVKQKNIVAVVDDQSETPPFLMMPYFPLGNLADQNHESRFYLSEIKDLLFQALSALDYLHERGTAHRDLKPENILVESRLPLKVRIADFGLANDNSFLETKCGTPLYVAPEVLEGSGYTTAVDIWSLGVIILNYYRGLPSANMTISNDKPKELVQAWSRRVVNHASKFGSDSLLDLLTTGMLRIDPLRRFSAASCLMRGRSTALFPSQSVNSGNATRRASQMSLRERSAQDGSTNVLLDALGSSDDRSSIPDESGAENSASLQHTAVFREPYSQAASVKQDGYNVGAGAASIIPSNDERSIADASCFLKADLTSPGCSKRLLSSAEGSADNTSSRARTKRRHQKDLSTVISIKEATDPTCQHSSDHQQPRKYGISYEDILALLMDLQLGDRSSRESKKKRLHNHINKRAVWISG